MTPEDQLRLLRKLVELESPTYSAGVRVVAERMAEELVALGASVELRPGDHLVAELDGQGDPLLVLGHTDTVWPEGTLERMPFRLENGRAHGPGAYDMKGGIYLALMAFRDAARLGAATGRPIRFLLSPDEEIGSPTTRALVEDLGRRSSHVLVMEPARPGGAAVTARKGVGWFDVEVEGRPAHAGSRHQDGRSAIRAGARWP